MTEQTPIPDASPQATALPSEAEVEATILELARAEMKSIDPTQAARALSTGDGWQRVLPIVRRVAVRLAQEGRLIIYRKGKPVDPSDFRGVYRLGVPRDE
ncbi:hypothetical protein GCM10007301_14050 [Azorhizobium oxalatiphilum]|uniref:DUF3253 domain-containing protein n=1 Tax=Azorhizobium oxalatiphilum TaxID=980631 RepID=A0A917BTD1_9HYPH|nr:DUF3253 domain-containing protein [Azorhizobium oxalatiphilum]GGF55585.1 hypothetical protein GCM10007301_14050 [Azorhizobium oxalatiphilum]